MARLEDLAAEVKDPALRQKLQGAIADLKRKQRFGLVFEEHIPETTALFGLSIQVGATVQRRDEGNASALYRVTAQNGKGKATIEPAEGGAAVAIPSKDLLVVKRFGDPIYPALTSLGSIRRGSADKPHHAVINGENFHTLQLFAYLYAGQVDCVYIDPPYNTGARDWKYNNRYVDKKDSWRHSKWLSMMDRRLRLTKQLLRQDGVLIVTIDEHEVHHLGMLLEKHFPLHLRHMVSIVINPKGTGKLNFARVDEYAIFCVPNTGNSIITGTPTAAAGARNGQTTLVLPDQDGDEDADDEAEDEEGEDDGGLEQDESEVLDGEDGREYPFPVDELPEWELRHARRRGGESSYRHQRWNQFYPIYVDPKEHRVARVGDSIPLDQQPDFSPKKGLVPIWPIDKEGNERCWRFIPKKMQSLVDQNRVVMGRYNEVQKIWTLNIWERSTLSKKLKTVWWETAHDAGTHGTTLLHKLLGRRDAFPFPKSVYAVRDCLAAVVRDRPEAVILDFFAGSGTTFHATCLLNAEDGGRRRSVMVTNNEVAEKVARQLAAKGHYRGDEQFERHGIFEQATRPRCEASLTGKRPDGRPAQGKYIDGTPYSAGFDENVEFFRVDYLDPDDVDLGTQFDAILPCLWLAAGGVGDRDAGVSRRAFSIPKGSNYAVLFRESAFRQFKNDIVGRPDVTHAWLVTDSEEAFAEMRSALPSRLVVSMLYRDYLRNFRINTRRTP